MLAGEAIAFSQRINREEIIPPATVEKVLSFCLLKGKPYRDRDMYLVEKSVPRICEEKGYLINTFIKVDNFFNTCLNIYNNHSVIEQKKIAFSILLEMVTEKLDHHLWHIEIRKKAGYLTKEEQKKTQAIFANKVDQGPADNTDKISTEDHT